LLLAMYLSLYILLAIPLSVLVMRLMAKKDEMIFRLIGLNLVFRFCHAITGCMALRGITDCP